MSDLGNEVVASARSRIGGPFRHHFKPNLCEGGTVTIDECMTIGMDPAGYDCSGLAIASICEVIGMQVMKWPRSLRHAKQLINIAMHKEADTGDLRLSTYSNGSIHLGIAVNQSVAVHASGVSLTVEEGIATDKYGPFVDVQSIAIDSLYKVLKATV